MNKTYIFGHKKPDTDSVAAAITLSYLKNKQGFKTQPMVLGEISSETKFVLDYFKVTHPPYLNDVKLQIKDINYQKGYYLNEDKSIYNAYLYMNENVISTLPVIDDDNKFIGMVSMKDITKDQVDGNIYNLNTSYKNIIDALSAEEVLKVNDEIIGTLIVASFRSTTFIETIEIKKDTVLIVGDRHSIIEYAVEKGAKLIILTGNREIKPKHLEIAKKNNVNIIKTPYDSFKVTKIINLCNYISTITIKEDVIYFNENEYVNDFIEKSNKHKYTSYPIINKQNECLGILRISDIVNKKRKKVILVDHNEFDQSVDGLEEAEIIEIVDHHKIGSISTTLPINFRNMPVGSTNTIIYSMFKEVRQEIPLHIAGLMLSGILSDTLLLTSPTTTEIDIKTVHELSKLIDINYIEFGKQMFTVGSSLKGKTKEQIFYNDFKKFTIDNHKIGIGQAFTMNADELLNQVDDYISLLNEIEKNDNYDVLTLFITDILNNGSYVLYSDNSKEILNNSFNINDIKQAHYLPGIVSRKKQYIPCIINEIEKK